MLKKRNKRVRTANCLCGGIKIRVKGNLRHVTNCHCSQCMKTHGNYASYTQCLEENIPVKVVKLDYSCIARAIAMRKTEGFFKIIVTNDKEMKILGMRAAGEHASSAIQAVALLIKMNKGIH